MNNLLRITRPIKNKLYEGQPLYFRAQEHIWIVHQLTNEFIYMKQLKGSSIINWQKQESFFKYWALEQGGPALDELGFTI